MLIADEIFLFLFAGFRAVLLAHLGAHGCRQRSHFLSSAYMHQHPVIEALINTEEKSFGNNVCGGRRNILGGATLISQHPS